MPCRVFGDLRRLFLKCDGTRTETRFRLSAKRTSPFKSAGASVQSTTGRRAVHISLQGLYCSCNPVFCSHVTLTGYQLYSLVSPFTSPPMHHRVPSHFNWTLPLRNGRSATLGRLQHRYTLFPSSSLSTTNHLYTLVCQLAIGHGLFLF
jgi:hypothetical protein